MGSITDLTGNHYGILVVLQRDTSKTRNPKWICQCQCGNIKSIYGSALRNGRTKSCGCQMNKGVKGINKKHGLTHTHIYSEWASMKSRCKPFSKNASSYYQRGITVCDEWVDDFMSFYNWALSNGYNESLTLDRIDNNKGYSPNNCRWTTNLTQSRNKQKTIRIMYQGQEYSLSELCEKKNFPYKRAYNRLQRLKSLNLPIDTDFIFDPEKHHNSSLA